MPHLGVHHHGLHVQETLALLNLLAMNKAGVVVWRCLRSRDRRGISIRRLAVGSKSRQASGYRPLRQKSGMAQTKPVIVIYERDAPFPAPQDKVESVCGSTAGIARDDDTNIALRNRGLSELLRRHRLP